MATLNKVCKKCGVERAMTEVYTDPSRPCKPCRSIEAKARYATSKAYYEDYRAAHKEKIADAKRAYYEANKEVIAQYWKNWAADNPEKIVATRTRFLDNHPDYEKNKATEIRRQLKNNYVKSLVSRNIKAVDIPQELIEAKRLQILINRRIRDENNDTTTR